VYEPTITIPNPDDPMGVPIFDGDPWDARNVLIPGVYRGTADYTDLADGMPDSDATRPGTLVVWDEKNQYPSLANVPGERGAEWIDDEYDGSSTNADGGKYFVVTWAWTDTWTTDKIRANNYADGF
jgi:hypothetical protein